ncbi:hypothetical protein [Pseudomonas sp. TCU-HL1]|uniref:hypothetical protein n=1 Tax=Pseudomonas sp. TCU-HL1 TaxID=1856685 RepID=UPI0011AB4072|nr:hypothetical protein [Pseudomonas sp. TCU-HL1]
MLFAHTLASSARCMHSGYALARWYERHRGEAKGSQRDNKWYAFFNGRLARGDLLEELVDLFPVLQPILDSPLWLSLTEEHGRRIDWEAAILAEREGKRLRVFSQPKLAAFAACPEWYRLGLLLMLLRTTSAWYALHRLWVSKNISVYVQMTCLAPPLSHISSELYRRLGELTSKGCFGIPAIPFWPANEREFRRNLRFLKLLAGRAVQKGWVPEVKPGAYLLLWILFGFDVEYRLRLVDRLRRRRWEFQIGCPSLVRYRLQVVRKAYLKSRFVK